MDIPPVWSRGTWAVERGGGSDFCFVSCLFLFWFAQFMVSKLMGIFTFCVSCIQWIFIDAFPALLNCTPTNHYMQLTEAPQKTWFR